VNEAPVPTRAGVTHITVGADVEHAGKLLHRVEVRNTEFLERSLRHRAEVPVEDLEAELDRVASRSFVFHSDEPAFLGGDDLHPAPLEYFAAGIGT
jgi:hypothetical protein